MIRLSVLLVAAGIAALILAQVTSRPPPPRFEARDLVGTWVEGGAGKCGADDAATLTVTPDGRATVHAGIYDVSGRLLATEGVRSKLFQSRTFTFLRLLDDQGTRWQLLFGSDSGPRNLEGAFGSYQEANGDFMVMSRPPHFTRCG